MIDTIIENKKAMKAILILSIIMFVMGLVFLEYTIHTRQEIVDDCNKHWQAQVSHNKCLSEMTALDEAQKVNWSIS
jgi:hypothetical protein